MPSIVPYAGTGLSQANLQLTQASQPAAGAPAAAQPKAYSLQNEWTSAAELSKLQAQASKQPQQQQQQQREFTAAEVQLMGLVEADGALDGAGEGQQAGSRQQGQRGVSSNSSFDKERFAGLKAYLAEKKQQEEPQKVAFSGVGGIAAPAVGAGLFSSARALGSIKPATAGAGAGAVRTAAPAAGGAPAAPRFGSRKPGTSKPPAAAAAKPPGFKRPASSSKVPAGLQAAQVEAESAAAAAEEEVSDPAAGGGDTTAAAAVPKLAPAVASKPAAPSFGKRPGAGDAAGKPPAAKKAKTAAAGAAGAGAAAKPKAPKKPKAAAGTGTAGAAVDPAAAAAGADMSGTPAAVAAGAGGAAAAGAAGEGTGSQQPAADQQQEKKKRTKAADLDLAAVTAKVQAAYAASGGAALKGVSVPEMQCYLRAQGVKGGSAKRADVEARLLGLLAGKPAAS